MAPAAKGGYYGHQEGWSATERRTAGGVKEAMLAKESTILRTRALRDMSAATASLSATARDVRKSLEDVYLTPVERLRLASSLTGLGLAAASLVAGAPAYIVAPRLATNILNIVKTGRRVDASRLSLPLQQVLEEILA